MGNPFAPKWSVWCGVESNAVASGWECLRQILSQAECLRCAGSSGVGDHWGSEGAFSSDVTALVIGSSYCPPCFWHGLFVCRLVDSDPPWNMTNTIRLGCWISSQANNRTSDLLEEISSCRMIVIARWYKWCSVENWNVIEILWMPWLACDCGGVTTSKPLVIVGHNVVGHFACWSSHNIFMILLLMTCPALTVFVFPMKGLNSIHRPMGSPEKGELKHHTTSSKWSF